VPVFVFGRVLPPENKNCEFVIGDGDCIFAVAKAFVFIAFLYICGAKILCQDFI
jgi:hypothetical protein